MKVETLKTLIKDVINNDPLRVVMSNETIELEKKIMKILELYEEDNKVTQRNDVPIFTPNIGGTYTQLFVATPDKVPYSQICSCNPENGGSGICGCTMANQLVDNPKKYPFTTNLKTSI